MLNGCVRRRRYSGGSVRENWYLTLGNRVNENEWEDYQIVGYRRRLLKGRNTLWFWLNKCKQIRREKMIRKPSWSIKKNVVCVCWLDVDHLELDCPGVCLKEEKWENEVRRSRPWFAFTEQRVWFCRQAGRRESGRQADRQHSVSAARPSRKAITPQHVPILTSPPLQGCPHPTRPRGYPTRERGVEGPGWPLEGGLDGWLVGWFDG